MSQDGHSIVCSLFPCDAPARHRIVLDISVYEAGVEVAVDYCRVPGGLLPSW